MDGPKTAPTQSDTVLTSASGASPRVPVAGPRRTGMAARRAQLVATGPRATSRRLLATANTTTATTAPRRLKKSAREKAGTIAQP